MTRLSALISSRLTFGSKRGTHLALTHMKSFTKTKLEDLFHFFANVFMHFNFKYIFQKTILILDQFYGVQVFYIYIIYSAALLNYVTQL